MATAPRFPKYHLLELTLAARIREGAYGEQGLPGERRLAAEFGVARVTVRTALARLAEQGLVSRVHRRGTTPAKPRGTPRDRAVLRDHIDQFVARGRPDRRTVLEFGLVAPRPSVAAMLGTQPGELVLRIVRTRAREGVTVAYTEAFLPAKWRRAITRPALTRRALVEVLEAAGLKIGSADQSISSEAALPPVDAGLGVPAGTPVLKIVRVMREPDGRPAQLLLAWYRADRFELRMRLSGGNDATRVWVEDR